MQSHQSSYKSDYAQFIRRHPGYALLFMMASFTAPAFDLRGLIFLYIGLRLGAEFYHEIKRRTTAPHKVKRQFQNKDLMAKDVQLGRLVHYENQLPVVEVYTDHPYMGPLTEARLMAPYYPDFHADYFRYLFLLARFLKGPWKKSAVEFINQEARRRGIKLDDANIKLHYVVKEVYGYIEEYNKTVPFYLQITDEFTLEHFRAIILFCEIERGLGRANGCISSVIDKKDGKKEAIHLTDWFTFGSLQDWQIHTLKIVSGQTVFSSGIIPGIVTITACNENSLSVAYNKASEKIGNQENPAGGYPGLLLTHNIAAECKTFEAVENYLNTHQPASGNIFTVVARGGHGIIEYMPNRSDPETGEAIPESACIFEPNGLAASAGYFDLTEISTEMRRKVEETREQLTPEKMVNMNVVLAVDEALIRLMHKLGELDQSHPVLAKQLSDFYSSLAEQCKLSATGSKKALLSCQDIRLIAGRTVEMVTAVQNRKMSHTEQFSQYERYIQDKIGKARYSFSYDSARLMDGLFVGVMSALFTHFTTNLVQQNVSPAFFQCASEVFSDEMVALFNARWMATTIVAALSASHFLFKPQPLAARANAVVNTLRKSLMRGI